MSSQIKTAFDLACEAHYNQMRKTGNTPYLAHIFHVTALVWEYGGDEQTAIAAMLHDTIEDSHGKITHKRISNEISIEVADIVSSVTDTEIEPRPGWHERKRMYLDKLEQADDRAKLISACDKLHNLENLWHDWQTMGDEVWSHFNASAEDSLQFYDAVFSIVKTSVPKHLADRLKTVLENLRSTLQ